MGCSWRRALALTPRQPSQCLKSWGRQVRWDCARVCVWGGEGGGSGRRVAAREQSVRPVACDAGPRALPCVCQRSHPSPPHTPPHTRTPRAQRRRRAAARSQSSCARTPSAATASPPSARCVAAAGERGGVGGAAALVMCWVGTPPPRPLASPTLAWSTPPLARPPPPHMRTRRCCPLRTVCTRPATARQRMGPCNFCGEWVGARACMLLVPSTGRRTSSARCMPPPAPPQVASRGPRAQPLGRLTRRTPAAAVDVSPPNPLITRALQL